MTKAAKTWIFFLASLLLLCGGIIFCLLNMNSKIKNENDQTMQRSKAYCIQLENLYEKSVFELADSLNNMHANLSKLHACNGVANQHKLITKIVSEAETAESDIACLPIDNDCLKKTAEFANRTSDFCLALQQKIAKGKSIGDSDRKTLKWLSATSQTLAKHMASICQQVGNEFMLSDGVLQNGKIGGIDNEFNEVDNATFDYPQMIYDGPFSDSKKHEVKVDLPVVSPLVAEQKVKEKLDFLGVKKVEYKGETKNKLDVYNFEVELKNGTKYYLQSSKNGGVICCISSAGCKGKADSKTTAMQLAKRFANKLGYNVEPVWVSKQNDGPTYVNLAPVVGGVIIYPDLIKVSIDDNGVCGFEGLNYLANHKTRVFDKMSRNDQKARQKLARGMKVKNSNLALVPKGEKEVLCFEFECVMDDEQYFVYIDANTLDEVDIFKVIKGTEGYTVM
ncbi:MAG: germination protein YpeB [Clostridia bacterium]|nr:germination protein YpeB [Clostridia bacterium]